MIRRTFLMLATAAGLAVATPALAANPVVEFDTSLGTFKVELYPDAAPKTVANFLDYVKAKYYDGLIFHRVIDGFMVQGGGFQPDYKQRPTRPPVVNETASAAKAGITNAVGTIAMARTSDPDSATAQFFINTVDNTDKLGARSGSAGYTPFGKVTSGMDVVMKIAKVAKGRGTPPPSGAPLDPADVPTEPVVIKSVKVVG